MLPNASPIKPTIGDLVPKEVLSKAYKTIHDTAGKRVLEARNIDSIESYQLLPEKDKEPISREIKLEAARLTKIYHENLRKQLGI